MAPGPTLPTEPPLPDAPRDPAFEIEADPDSVTPVPPVSRADMERYFADVLDPLENAIPPPAEDEGVTPDEKED